ncbi:MAG TPA: hypothetical protein DCL61_30290 [Cyanobacteria bacterium UBA12227]|nr:hypothetical protein [Cyanobacteria bacterium UBA12227]
MLQRKVNSIIRNRYAFVEFGFSFISNAFVLQRKVNSIIRNRYAFVEFGFPFIINAFSFQKNMKALLINGNSFVEVGFPLAGKPFKILAWATPRYANKIQNEEIHSKQVFLQLLQKDL